jgi:hypothetical protein
MTLVSVHAAAKVMGVWAHNQEVEQARIRDFPIVAVATSKDVPARALPGTLDERRRSRASGGGGRRTGRRVQLLRRAGAGTEERGFVVRLPFRPRRRGHQGAHVLQEDHRRVDREIENDE